MIKLLLSMKAGTQDPESVAVVFETLQSLYKENRIVGIIRMLLSKNEFPVPSMCLKTKKRKFGKRKLN
jgi:hypothetical protein